MFTMTLEQGDLKHADSPLLRAIKFGRVIVVDEADKAPAHVVAVLRSLGGHGEMTLSDGRRVRPPGAVTRREGDIVVHHNFRMILLANRPGYRKFLGILCGNPFRADSMNCQRFWVTISYRSLVKTLAG